MKIQEFLISKKNIVVGQKLFHVIHGPFIIENISDFGCDHKEIYGYYELTGHNQSFYRDGRLNDKDYSPSLYLSDPFAEYIKNSEKDMQEKESLRIQIINQSYDGLIQFLNKERECKLKSKIQF